MLSRSLYGGMFFGFSFWGMLSGLAFLSGGILSGSAFLSGRMLSGSAFLSGGMLSGSAFLGRCFLGRLTRGDTFQGGKLFSFIDWGGQLFLGGGCFPLCLSFLSTVQIDVEIEIKLQSSTPHYYQLTNLLSSPLSYP